MVSTLHGFAFAQTHIILPYGCTVTDSRCVAECVKIMSKSCTNTHTHIERICIFVCTDPWMCYD